MTILKRLSRYDCVTTPYTFKNYSPLYSFAKDFKDAIFNPSEKTVYIEHPYLFLYYPVGGYQGGNCWDDTPPTYRAYDNERPQLHSIFLELTGFQLQELKVKTYTFTDYEYYGNSTDYEVLVICLNQVKELYEKYKLPSIL